MKRAAQRREWHLIDMALREARRLNLSTPPLPPADERSRITVEVMNRHFRKYHFGGGVALHHFTGPDLGDAHDHPGAFATQIIKPYVEDIYTIHPGGDWSVERVAREAGTSHVVQAVSIHRIVALPQGESLTLVRYQPHERETHFYRFAQGVTRRQWRRRTWTAVG